ncbi:Hypothetical protein LUCI_3334 [Lucifera butyrica]|uniref:Uncharacterized protein n=1 Tax=Lucifera butyrica TaxID=1351585 RepID=A0A498RA86_9FIRM|nr:hypothetical protein [Lucifera butyrica]VBB08069.1 Hypothetical protein LUCI_3334 [Lucifera butyrica]
MFKLRFALLLSLIVGFITLIMSILHDLRIDTIIYRVSISIIVFAAVGFGVGYFTDSFLNKVTAEQKPQGQIIDIKNEPEDSAIQAASESFRPLDQNDLQHVTRSSRS